MQLMCQSDHTQPLRFFLALTATKAPLPLCRWAVHDLIRSTRRHLTWRIVLPLQVKEGRPRVSPTYLHTITSIGMCLLNAHNNHPKHEKETRGKRRRKPYTEVKHVRRLHKKVEYSHKKYGVDHDHVEEAPSPGKTTRGTRAVLHDLSHNKAVGNASYGKWHKEEKHPVTTTDATVLGQRLAAFRGGKPAFSCYSHFCGIQTNL